MITRFKIILIILSLITPTILMGHKVTLEDKSLEEIVTVSYTHLTLPTNREV